MIASGWLRTAQDTLSKHSTSPLLDAEVLLCDALDRNKAWLIAHGDTPLQGATLQRLESQLKRRVSGEPLAYIRGFAEFYGRRFEVNKHVLVPRPESETMIELLVTSAEGIAYGAQELRIIDIGTGSGALGITALLEVNKLYPKRYALSPALIDIDQNCLKIAQKNARTYSAKVKLLQGNLLDPLSTYDLSLTTVLLANLPYVPDDYEINDAAKHEPKLALFAGKDGLDLYRELFEQLKSESWKAKEVTVYTESLDFQHDDLRKIAKGAGFMQKEGKDLIQVFSLIPNS